MRDNWKKGAQRKEWQSDSRIVPMKLLKGSGGKSRGNIPHVPDIQSNIKEETLSIHGGR